MDADVLARGGRAHGARRPFALATVVWRRAPSSGHVGSKASCSATAPCEAGSAARARSRPSCARRWRRWPTGGRGCCSSARPTSWPPAITTRHVTVPMACESEGAMEIYLEPFLPAPQVVVIGRSPAVHALTVQARSLEWDVAVIDDGGIADEHPHPELVRTTLDLAGLGIGPSTAIVVATQGHYDDLALGPRSHTDAGYIGLVAAEKRASSLLAAAARPGRRRRAAGAGARAGRPRPRPGRQRRDRGGGARRSRRPPRRGPAPRGARRRRRGRPSTRCAA